MLLDQVLYAIAILFSLGFVEALGGIGGAFANACVYFEIQPVSKFNISFKAGSEFDHCMNYGGHNATVEINKEGLTCASVGYVEEKGSLSAGDTCATDESVWGLSYHGGPYSGAALSSWKSGELYNQIQLFDADAGTHVCDWKELCRTSGLRWDSGTLGPFYIIFRPGTSASLPHIVA